MPEDLELSEGGGFLEARYLGSYTLEGFKSQMERSVQAAREKNLTRLLVDVRGLLGYAPSTVDRYEIGRFGAEISEGLWVAALGTVEQFRDTFSTRVAQNRGVLIEVFTDRSLAIAWLLQYGG
jgi:hypothetical protein